MWKAQSVAKTATAPSLYLMEWQTERHKPGIVKWAHAFCYLNALFQLAFIIGGIYIMMNAQSITELMASPNEQVQGNAVLSPAYWSNTGLTLLLCGLIFGPLNIWLATTQPKPVHYVLHAANFLAGILSCCCAPIGIPLLVLWFKPEAREYFDFR